MSQHEPGARPKPASFQIGGDTSAAPPAKTGLIKDTTTAGFAIDVIQESRHQPVLVDFWAPWCGPCKQLTPALERIVVEARGAVKLVKMNIDEHPTIAGQLGIQSIPAVIAFKNGQPVDGFMGAVPETQIRDFIKRLDGGAAVKADIEAGLFAAAEMRAAGDLPGAAEIYDTLLAEFPDNVAAMAGLASVFVDSGDLEQARAVLATVPADKQGGEAIASVRARIALLEQQSAIGDPRALERRLAADPSDHAARFDLALLNNAAGDRVAAADGLLAIVRADRGWNDSAARSQLLQFFEAWGMSDPATLAARRKLSSLLFS